MNNNWLRLINEDDTRLNDAGINGCEEVCIPEAVYSCVQYSDSCVHRSIRKVVKKSWKIDHFLILIKSITLNPLVHQKTTHLSYPYTNLGHVTVADLVRHSRFW